MNLQYFTNTKAPTLAITYDATISASTAVTFNTASTTIEVSAIDKGVFMKWAATASSSSFDEFISANTTRVYVIPSGTPSAQFIEESATAKLVVIEK
jgi:hypothetical protein